MKSPCSLRTCAPRPSRGVFFAILFAAAAGCSVPRAAATNSSWNGTNGLWSDGLRWSTSPVFPDNSNVGAPYDAFINAGNVELEAAHTIENFTLGGAQLFSNTSEMLTVNNLAHFTGNALIKSDTIQANTGLQFMGSIQNIANVQGTGTLINNGTSGLWNASAGDAFVYGFDAAIFRNTSSGIFDVQTNSGNGFLFNNGSPLIDNLGTFVKSAGTGNFAITWAFDNTGTLRVDSGSVSLGRGGTSIGLFQATNADNAITLTGGTHTFHTGMDVAGAGKLRLTGGTVSFADAVGTGHSNFEFSAGTANGAGSLSVNNVLLTHNTDYTGGATITGQNGVQMTGGLNQQLGTVRGTTNLVNNGSGGFWNATVGSSFVYGGDTGTFTNTATGIFDVQVNSSNGFLYNSGNPAINNAGLFSKSLGDANFAITWAFNNTGTVQVDSGSISLGRGGVSNGLFQTTNDSNAIVLNGGTHTFHTGMDVEGAGRVRLTNGTATFADAVGTGHSNFEFSGGTANGAGSLSVNNVLLTHATDYTGGATITGQNGAQMTGSLNQQLGTVRGTTNLVNNGPGGFWNATMGNSFVYGGDTGIFTNTATGIFDVQVNSSNGFLYNGGNPAINNAGLFSKSVGTGNFAITWGFNNSGTLRVDSGSISLGRGGLSNGLFQATNVGNAIILNGGAHIFAVGTSIVGAGVLRTTNGSLTIMGPTSGAANVDFSGGTVNGASNLTVNNLLMTNATDFPDAPTLTGQLGVQMTGSLSQQLGTVRGTTNIVNDGPGGLWNATAGNSFVYGADIGRFTNTATGVFDVQVDSTNGFLYNGGNPAIDNAGLFSKSAGANNFAITWGFNNSGTLRVDNGSISLGRGGVSNGLFQTTNASNTIVLNGGTHTFHTGMDVEGAGRVRLTNGTATFADAVGTGHSNFEFSGGTANGAGSLSVNNVLLTHATDYTGGATITGQNGAQMTGSLNQQLGTVRGTTNLVNNGPGGFWNATMGNSFVYGGDTGIFTNTATGIFDVQVDSSNGFLYNGGNPAINNAGLFSKSVGTNNFAITWGFNNTGTLRVDSGSISLGRGGTDTGLFQATNANNAIILNGGTHTFNAGTTFAGAGSTRITNGTATFAAAVGNGQGTFDFSGGTANGTGSLNADHVLLTHATDYPGGVAITGQSSVQMTGGLNQQLGHIRGTTNLVNHGGGGVWNATAGNSFVYGSGTGVFTNSAGAVFDIQVNSGNGFLFNGGTPSINNAGTFSKSAGNAAFLVTWAFNNTGTVRAQSGQLQFNSTVTQSSGSTLTGGTWQVLGNGSGIIGTGIANVVTNNGDVLLSGAGSNFPAINTLATNGGSFRIQAGRSFTTAGALGNTGHVTVDDAATTLTVTGNYTQTAGETTLLNNGALTATNVNLHGGKLDGTGSVTGTLASNAEISPGQSAGAITVNGTATLGGSSFLRMQVGGTAAGAYDTLAVNGSIALGGTLDLSFLNSFQQIVQPGSTFVIVSSTNLTGAFSNVASGDTLNTSDGFGSFKVFYGPTSPYDPNSVVLAEGAGTPIDVVISLLYGTGDQVPGEPAGTTFKTFGIPSLDGTKPGFLATIKPPTGSAVKAVIGGSTTGVIVRKGDPAPDAGGAKFSNFKDPVFGGGRTAFTASLSGALSTNNSGIWSDQGGSLALIARKGDPAPNTGGATYAAFKSLALPDAAGPVFVAKLLAGTGTPAVTTANDVGVWRKGTGGVALVLREGDQLVVDAGAPRTVKTISVLGNVGGSPDQRRAFLADGTLYMRVTFTDGSQAVINAPGDGSPFILEALNGVTQLAGGSGAAFKSFGIPAASATGLGFLGKLATGPGSVTSANALGLFNLTPGGFAPIIQIGTPAPGANGATFSKFKDPAFGGTDTVTFLGNVKVGTGSPAAAKTNDTGIWSNASGTLALLAREGDPAAEIPGATYAKFVAVEFHPDAAPVRADLFTAKLALTGGITTANNFGLWGVDALGVVHKLGRTGDPVTFGGGPQPIRVLTALKNGSGSPGQGRATNNQGATIYRAGLGSAGQVILKAQMP